MDNPYLDPAYAEALAEYNTTQVSGDLSPYLCDACLTKVERWQVANWREDLCDRCIQKIERLLSILP